MPNVEVGPQPSRAMTNGVAGDFDNSQNRLKWLRIKAPNSREDKPWRSAYFAYTCLSPLKDSATEGRSVGIETSRAGLDRCPGEIVE